MAVRQRDGPDTTEGAGETIEGTAGNSNAKTSALFAYSAGVTGILANLFLIVFYALQLTGRRVDAMPFGTANELMGPHGTALMIPVALGVRLPNPLACRIVQALGISAMAILVAGGPLVVLGLLSFEAQGPIAMGAWAFLGLWLLGEG